MDFAAGRAQPGKATIVASFEQFLQTNGSRITKINMPDGKSVGLDRLREELAEISESRISYDAGEGEELGKAISEIGEKMWLIRIPKNVCQYLLIL